MSHVTCMTWCGMTAYISVTWIIHRDVMTYPHVWHDSSYMRNVTHPQICEHPKLIKSQRQRNAANVTSHIHMCDMKYHVCVTCLIHRDVIKPKYADRNKRVTSRYTHNSFTWLVVYVWYDSFTCVSLCMWDMTHSHVCCDICGTWLIHMCVVIYVGHDSFKGTWATHNLYYTDCNKRVTSCYTHNAFTRATWLVMYVWHVSYTGTWATQTTQIAIKKQHHVTPMTHSHVWHDSSRMCDMSHA